MDVPAPAISAKTIDALDFELAATYRDRLAVEPSLSRQIVSFQANKARPAYRWYKYKEAFSASLVERLLSQNGVASGRLLDPFAGSGTALFAASAAGLAADGIELLPIGHEIIRARRSLNDSAAAPGIIARLQTWIENPPYRDAPRRPLPVLRITDGAYPPETLESLERFMGAWEAESEPGREILRFALLCVLEEISYTRKDGQYLRWDARSGRRQGAEPFHKGPILAFDTAIGAKIREIIEDVNSNGRPFDLFADAPPVLAPAQEGGVRLLSGSCLDLLPTLPDASYDVIFTSPPYCNRYDYTRTYALELALLGVGTQEIVALRQEMLTCTVENRAKDLVGLNPAWSKAVARADDEPLLQAILCYLDTEKERGTLNNTGIPRMVRGYFYEMACVIAECARVLKPGAPLFMVNDNVRYSGVPVPVDLILSHLAEGLGFTAERILVLPNGKGNSSQQMGKHGREPLRKCVYVWRRK